MKEFTFETTGTCAKYIHFSKEGNRIYNISFEGGCNGNLKAISRLCEGMDANEIVGKLRGNICGSKRTSCADQLALALLKVLETN